jgi:hypothetical protein
LSLPWLMLVVEDVVKGLVFDMLGRVGKWLHAVFLVIRILMGIGYRESCRESFKELKILTLSLQYIFSLLLSAVYNRGYYASNSVYHHINTKQKKYLHLPHVSLTMYQKGVFYSGIKVFNALPMTIKDISSIPKKLKLL